MFKTAIRDIILKYKTPETRTRKINPKLGLLGFAGFTGFLGFGTYSVNQTAYAFTFFAFFGFFGFFFEGKMSNTLIDERFKENIQRAKIKAYETGFTLTFFALVLIPQANLSLENTARAFIITISLICALTMFLVEYLLYKYDHDDQMEQVEE